MPFFFLEFLDSINKVLVVQFRIITEGAGDAQPSQRGFCVLTCHGSVVYAERKMTWSGMFEVRLESLDKRRASEHVEIQIRAPRFLANLSVSGSVKHLNSISSE
jgi:hypothetical protein